jgi:cysteine synthase
VTHATTNLGLDTHIVDRSVYDHAVARCREGGIRLPTFAELMEPERIPEAIQEALSGVHPDAPHPLNLFRIHWQNGMDRSARVDLPEYLVLPRELTGVPSPILVLLGDRFPMIGAHKVLATYACLAPRLVTGQFDPVAHRAVWPSTGNYCRGGVAVSRIMGCRGVAVLPEGMSAERFRWLEEWVSEPGDIIRTPGSESNVKEIYDECARLSRDPANVVINQFCEFGNHLAHFFCTGQAAERVLLKEREGQPELELAAFVSASGSAGTLAAGDYLKERFGSRTVAVEALECPTMLYNGFGEHNIQGIGDKHIPLIHNVTNTDLVTAVSDVSTDSLNVLFNTEAGRRHLVNDRDLAPDTVEALSHLGLSSICNVLACIQVSKHLGLGPAEALVTVATDGAQLYSTEIEKAVRKHFAGGFDSRTAQRTFEECLLRVDTRHLLELSPTDRDRIFNLGYFTWVEQQGVSLEDFGVRRGQEFWRGLRDLVAAWDERITAFNGETRLRS